MPRTNPGYASMVFTINNYTEEDVERVKNLDATRVRCGKEVGAQGTPHLQGAVTWRHAITFKTAQERLLGPGRGCYTAKMMGSWDAQEYTLKEGNVVRDDPGPSQGERTDVADFRDAIKRGLTDDELNMEQPGMCAKYPRYIDFTRNASSISKVERLPKGSKRLGVWLWSREPDLGKTTWVEDEFEDNLYEKMCHRWWCEYNDEEVVLIDDPKACWAPAFWDELKIWCNEKPFKAQSGVAKGSRMIRFKKMYVTANMPPEEYFGDKYDEKVFKARFRVKHIATPMWKVVDGEKVHDSEAGVV